MARRGIDSVMDEVYAVLKPIRSAVDKAKVASVGMIKQDLAEHEEKHGMDYPAQPDWLGSLASALREMTGKPC